MVETRDPIEVIETNILSVAVKAAQKEWSAILAPKLEEASQQRKVLENLSGKQGLNWITSGVLLGLVGAAIMTVAAPALIATMGVPIIAAAASLAGAGAGYVFGKNFGHTLSHNKDEKAKITTANSRLDEISKEIENLSKNAPERVWNAFKDAAEKAASDANKKIGVEGGDSLLLKDIYTRFNRSFLETSLTEKDGKYADIILQPSFQKLIDREIEHLEACVKLSQAQQEKRAAGSTMVQRVQQPLGDAGPPKTSNAV